MCEREKIDQPLVFPISHYFSPPEEKTEKRMKRAASRLLPGWPELKSRGTTITTIAAAAAVATLAKNKTLLLSAAAQSSTVLEDIPSVHQGLQSYSGHRPKPLAWILSQNDLQKEGSAFL